MNSSTYRGRLAPSRTGYLHIGHAATFWRAQSRCRARGGRLVLRIEDLDRERCRPGFENALLEDLAWFRLSWDEGPHRQSERRDLYLAAWRKLRDAGLIYPCECSRRDLLDSAAAPHPEDEEPIYPGTCRPERLTMPNELDPAGCNWRFRVPPGELLEFDDGCAGPQRARAGSDFGDFVVWRKDDTPAYQLAVVVDDAAMKITEVVRGADLLLSTFRQLLLYRALDLAPPKFFHAPLLTDSLGERLAKRHDAQSAAFSFARRLAARTARAILRGIFTMKIRLFLVTLAFGFTTSASAAPVAPPPAGKLYQGLFFSAVSPASDDANEHNVTAHDVAEFEKAVGAQTAWIYFSDNWFESRTFPEQTCTWIRSLGKIPYVRLMLRSDLDQNHGEKSFSLTNIAAGRFDDDLRRWAGAAKNFGTPILIEWGTEPNGDWFAWNGKWNGRRAGPARYIAAYRHIVDLMRAAGATNLQWVWHVNWDDQPETKWNRLGNYFPGENYCAWMALSAYGALTPQTREEIESFRTEVDLAYRRLTSLAPGRPIIIAEFGFDIHYRESRAASWARAALQDLFSGRWPAIIGFCWWNESWENDDVAAHNSDLNILHDPKLTAVFRDELRRHRAKIQPTPVVPPP